MLNSLQKRKAQPKLRDWPSRQTRFAPVVFQSLRPLDCATACGSEVAASQRLFVFFIAVISRIASKKRKAQLVAAPR